MPAVDNRALSRVREVVFANSSAYHVELPMAGRAEESEVLHTALNQSGPRLVSIHAPLGAGKTFLLNKVLGAHAVEVPDFDERRNVSYVLATTVEPPENTETLEPDDEGSMVDPCTVDEMPQTQEVADGHDATFEGVRGGQVLIVEELDRKATLGQILWSIAGALAWLHRGGDRLVILTGDATIRNRKVSALTEGVESHRRMSLEPLDIGLLEEAVHGRILDKMVRSSMSGEPEAVQDEVARTAAQQLLADAFVRWSAVPHAVPNSLANFREALGALRDLSAVAPALDGKVELHRELLATFDHESGAPSGSPARLEGALMANLREQISIGTPIAPLTHAELAAIADAPDADDLFRRRSVNALAQIGLLVPLGTPFEERDGRGELVSYAEPFVPGYPMVHRALAQLVSG